jgi:hypothetical protein
MWGRGIYFAVNAEYSCRGYKFTVPNCNNVYEVFSANVIIGNEKDFGPSNDGCKAFKEPPCIPNSTERYDSVKGHTGGSDVFIVYKN